jgi:hypothetical protein
MRYFKNLYLIRAHGQETLKYRRTVVRPASSGQLIFAGSDVNEIRKKLKVSNENNR